MSFYEIGSLIWILVLGLLTIGLSCSFLYTSARDYSRGYPRANETMTKEELETAYVPFSFSIKIFIIGIVVTFVGSMLWLPILIVVPPVVYVIYKREKSLEANDIVDKLKGD